MITLTLLSPHNSNLVQKWQFNSQSTIRIGRSKNNDVILYSAVVSRYHLELRNHGFGWELLSYGVNGTYIDGERVYHVAVEDGMLINIGDSGPKIRINITGAPLNNQPQCHQPSTELKTPHSSEKNTFIVRFPSNHLGGGEEVRG